MKPEVNAFPDYFLAGRITFTDGIAETYARGCATVPDWSQQYMPEVNAFPDMCEEAERTVSRDSLRLDIAGRTGPSPTQMPEDVSSPTLAAGSTELRRR